MGKDIFTEKIFDAVAIAKSGSSLSRVIDLTGVDGYFSIQATITGDGSAKFELLLSNDGVDFIEPTSATDIATGHTKTSGPGGDGKDIYRVLPPMVARFAKIRTTEAGVNGIVATITFASQ